MLINRQSGQVSFTPHLVFRPQMSTQDFVQLIALASWTLVDYGVFKNYSTQLTDDPYTYAITLYFQQDRLTTIALGLVLPGERQSWTDWSQDREDQRKVLHDELLRSLLNSPPYTFVWGSVTSVFDAKAGSSIIWLSYDDQRKPLQ